MGPILIRSDENLNALLSAPVIPNASHVTPVIYSASLNESVNLKFFTSVPVTYNASLSLPVFSNASLNVPAILNATLGAFNTTSAFLSDPVVLKPFIAAPITYNASLCLSVISNASLTTSSASVSDPVTDYRRRTTGAHPNNTLPSTFKRLVLNAINHYHSKRPHSSSSSSPSSYKTIIFTLSLILISPRSIDPLSSSSTASADAQRTYRRECDCEYQTDGRCAYTLLLPSPSSPSSPSCPLGGGNWTDRQATAFEDLSSSVAALYKSALENSVLMATLQSRLYDMQAKVSGLAKCDGGSCNNAVNTSGLSSWWNASFFNGTQERMLLDLGNSYNVLKVNLDSVQNRLNNLDNRTKLISAQLAVLQQRQQSGNGTNPNPPSQQPPLLPSPNPQPPTVDYQQQINQLTARLTVAEANILNLSNALNRTTLLPSSSVYCPAGNAFVFTGTKVLVYARITVSSYYGQTNTSTFYQTTMYINFPDAWCPAEQNSAAEYVQIDLGNPAQVHGVVTRGRPNYDQWITYYKVSFTGSTVVNLTPDTVWITVQDSFGIADYVFQGNVNRDSLKVNYFEKPMVTKFLRILPHTQNLIYGQMANSCARVDIIYCPQS